MADSNASNLLSARDTQAVKLVFDFLKCMLFRRAGRLIEPREDLGWEYWVTRQCKQAADVYREMLRIDPSYKTAVIREDLVSALAADGQYDEARKLASEWRVE
jgi:tetratricopeptide (TPR) repeat protein